jgi:A/G-specific adenine glycosylase
MTAKRAHISSKTIERFRRIVPRLLDWYSANRREFFWRGLRTNPYRVLVSEFMLQQTQASTIDKFLPQFLQQFPTVERLAAAKTSEVVQAWQGLGYNRRALNLHKAAKAIATRKNLGFPNTFDELMELPGVGHYTASALLVFSFGAEIPLADVNVERVLSRLWKPMKTTDEKLSMPEILAMDAQILPVGQSSDWHQALMDFGATICTKRAPKCVLCPLQKECNSAIYLSTMAPAKAKTSKARTTKAKTTNVKAPKAPIIKAKTSKAQVAKSTGSQVSKTEMLMFGQPNRIWRGRVLTVIANRGRTRLGTIMSILSELHGREKKEKALFTAYLDKVLRELKREGFLQSDKKWYSLKS